MSLAALEALIAGLKVRCEVVERDRHGRLVAKVYSPNGVDIGRRLVSSGGPWRTGGTRRTTSPPRTRHERPGAGCGAAPSSNLEGDQVCQRDGRLIARGNDATRPSRRWSTGASWPAVAARPRWLWPERRGVCTMDGYDIGATMVRQGPHRVRPAHRWTSGR
jgi:hypothetical protein